MNRSGLVWSSREDRFQVAVVKERDTSVLQSEKCVQLGPVRAEVRSQVEGVVFPHYSEPDWTSALGSSKVPVVWSHTCWMSVFGQLHSSEHQSPHLATEGVLLGAQSSVCM